MLNVNKYLELTILIHMKNTYTMYNIYDWPQKKQLLYHKNLKMSSFKFCMLSYYQIPWKMLKHKLIYNLIKKLRK